MNLNNNDTFFRRNSFLLISAAWVLTFAFIINNYWSGSSTSNAGQKAIQKYININQKRIDAFCLDTSLINTIVKGNYDESFLKNEVDKDYFIFFYKISDANNSIPVFWNTQVIEPDSSIIYGYNGISFQKLLNGWYVINKRTYKSATGDYYKMIFLIPVKWNYYVENKYLQNSFVAESNIEKTYDVSTNPTRHEIKDSKGQPLFYLRQLRNPIEHDNPLAMWLRILASVLILFFIHKLANFYVERKGFWHGFLILIIPVIFLRFLSYRFHIPLNFQQLKLFDPSVYGSNFFIRSLGDLLINSILFIWIVLFIRYHFNYDFSGVRFKNEAIKYSAIIALVILMILITLIGGYTVQSLVSDANISFDVINFFTLNIYSVIGFIVLSCIATGYFFLVQLLLQPLDVFIGHQKRYLLYLVIAVTDLIILTFMRHSSYVSFNLFLFRSAARRVGTACRSRWSPYH